MRDKEYMEEPGNMAPRPKVTFRTFLRPLKLLMEKDILVTLIFGGTVYAVWSMVVASTTGLFKDRFALNDLLLGLVFFPNGKCFYRQLKECRVRLILTKYGISYLALANQYWLGLGTIAGSAVAGILMTREFQNSEKVYMEKNPTAAPPSKNRKNFPADFPIEHARLLHAPWITILFIVTTSLYGFTVLSPSQLPLAAAKGWITVPLILQFFIAATSNAIFAINTTLVADLCPGMGASATAINNLVRCGMGALGVGLIDLMLGAFGAAATFLGLGILTAATGVLLSVEWIWGMQWRNERLLKTQVVASKA